MTFPVSQHHGQGIFFCPNRPLSQKKPFIFCAAVRPGPMGHLLMSLSDSADISHHTQSPPSSPAQAANPHKFCLGADCLWWPGKHKQGLTSGHPPSPRWGSMGRADPHLQTQANDAFITHSQHLWGPTLRRHWRAPANKGCEASPSEPEPVVFLQQLRQNTQGAKDSCPRHRISRNSFVYCKHSSPFCILLNVSGLVLPIVMAITATNLYRELALFQGLF